MHTALLVYNRLHRPSHIAGHAHWMLVMCVIVCEQVHASVVHCTYSRPRPGRSKWIWAPPRGWGRPPRSLCSTRPCPQFPLCGQFGWGPRWLYSIHIILRIYTYTYIIWPEKYTIKEIKFYRLQIKFLCW